MKLNVQSATGKSSSITALEAVFDFEYKEALLHEVVTSYRINGRSGNSAQLSRSDVRGGGAKPWRQKGTGRARAGTSRGPLWRSGGVTFAASKRDYHAKINRKVYRQAMKIILSELIRKDRLVVIDKLEVEAKTKSLVSLMSKLTLDNALFVTDKFDTNLSLAARNLTNTAVVLSTEINPIVLLSYDKVCVTVAALQEIEGRLS